MISKVIDDNSVSVIPEDSDDLLTLRRIVKKGDRIIGDTTRVIKQEKDFSADDWFFKAYNEAQKALGIAENSDEEFTWSNSEIDRFLPQELRLNSQP